MFHANKLCIPDSFVRLLLLQEAHGGGLMGHFGMKKTEDILATHLFWPKMRRDVERFVAHCTTCQKAKSRLNHHGLYMPLLAYDSMGGYIYGFCLRITSNKEGEG